MSTGPDSQIVPIGDWTVRVRQPESRGAAPVLALLHGWTGDENSMWIFSARLPREFYLIAPRGRHPAPTGGYGWLTKLVPKWPAVDDFRPAVAALFELLSEKNFLGGDFSRMHLMGFSQGAALAFAFALLHPQRVASVVGLSGFLPHEAEALTVGQPLLGIPVFVAHGTQDPLVSVDEARRTAKVLELAGAEISYCEDEVGHRLSADCFKGLEAFFQTTVDPKKP